MDASRLVVILLFVLFSLVPSRSKAQLAPGSIEAAHQYSASRSGIGMIVKEQGKVRFEKYYGGHSQNEAIHIYSGTKSFFGALAVIAENEGILSLDERVAETLVEWRSDPRKQLVTIRDLLNFTSGLETGFQQIYGRSTADKLTMAVGLQTNRDRGSAFVYGPSHLQVFCEVLRRKLAAKGMTYDQYLDRKLIQPLDIKITQWRADNHGNVIPSAGMYMTGRDWLSFGEMVIQGGSWKGRRIVPPASLGHCFESTPINPAFGLSFWVNSNCGNPSSREVDVEEYLDREPMPVDWSHACLSKAAPPDLICSLGSNFQRLYMVPSMQLVVVHQGKKGGRGFRDAEFLQILFKDAEFPTGTTERKAKSILPKMFESLRKRP